MGDEVFTSANGIVWPEGVGHPVDVHLSEFWRYRDIELPVSHPNPQLRRMRGQQRNLQCSNVLEEQHAALLAVEPQEEAR